MRVLLDEMLPRTLAQHLSGAETVLVLPTSKLDTLLSRLAEIEAALLTIRPGMVVELS